MEKMAYRFPTTTDFEEYMKKILRNKGSFRKTDGTMEVYDKLHPDPWEEYKPKEDCGCLRKLHQLSAQVAKKELEQMAAPDDGSKLKVNLQRKRWRTRQ